MKRSTQRFSYEREQKKKIMSVSFNRERASREYSTKKEGKNKINKWASSTVPVRQARRNIFYTI
jgi:hypothetical protein